ncbi:hypothetical protein MMPV_006003 [Pyropia vietnamensis]
MAPTLSTTTFRVVTLVAAVMVVAILATAPVRTDAQAVNPIYIGSPTDACTDPVGSVTGTCACSMVTLTERPSVLPPVEESRLWCDVRPRSLTQYFCDEAGTATCNVVCSGRVYYCAAGSLRFEGKQCECAMTGKRVVVVPQ